MLELFDKNGDIKKLSEKEEVDLKIDKSATIIDELPTSEKDTSQFVYINRNIIVGSVTIPQFSRGVLINNARSRDAVAIIVDANNNLYLCFRNNLVWHARKI